MKYINYGNSFNSIARESEVYTMVLAKELLNEGINTLSTLKNLINNRILSKSATLKPTIVSISQRIIDALDSITKLFELASNKVGELESNSSIIINPWWSLTVYEDRVIIKRLKPVTVIVSFSKSEGKIKFNTKTVRMEISPGRIILKKHGLTVEFDPTDPEDLSKQINDIKYVLKDVMRVLEIMVISAEKRLAA